MMEFRTKCKYSTNHQSFHFVRFCFFSSSKITIFVRCNNCANFFQKILFNKRINSVTRMTNFFVSKIQMKNGEKLVYRLLSMYYISTRDHISVQRQVDIFHTTFLPGKQSKIYRNEPKSLPENREQKNGHELGSRVPKLCRSTQFFNTASEKYALLPFAYLYLHRPFFC